jgi:hypothetical protein
MIVRSKLLLSLMSATWFVSACTEKPAVIEPKTLSVERISGLIKPFMKKGESADLWASDLHRGLTELSIATTPDNTCAVIAIIEQESGFKADPEVANIRQVLAKKIEKMQSNVMLALALKARMMQIAANGKTFEQNMQTIRTERDFELWYNEFVAAKYTMLGLKYMNMDVSDIVTTAGSMQVSVDYARDVARRLGKPASNIREELYTRPGGMLYGSAHLLSYPADYSKMYYRFADYNAGHYASRNAAFQKMVMNLTGVKTVGLDGDLLSYKNGTASTSKTQQAILAYSIKQKWPITPESLMSDLKREKEPDFIRTQTYQHIAEQHHKQFGKVLTEQVPSIVIKSDKITRKLTTQWYADNVQRRYANCMTRV